MKSHYKFNGLMQVRICTHDLKSYNKILYDSNVFEDEIKEYVNSSLPALALEHASNDLYQQFVLDDDNQSMKKVIGGAFKYLDRHANRTTPFGSFVAHRAYRNDFSHTKSSEPIISKGQVRIAYAPKFHELLRMQSTCDASYLIGLNPTLVIFGDAFTWVHLVNRISGATKNMRLKRTPVLSMIVKYFKSTRFASRGAVTDLITNALDGVRGKRIKTFIDSLLNIGFLEVLDNNDTDANKSLFTSFPIDLPYPDEDTISPIRSCLRSIRLKEMHCERTLDAAGEIVGHEFIELELDQQSEIHLKKEEIQTLEQAINAIISTSTLASDTVWNLTLWSNEFVEKFGLNNPIPVTVALNPLLGIGPPFGYGNPAPSSYDSYRASPSKWRQEDLDFRLKMISEATIHRGVESIDISDQRFEQDLFDLQQRFDVNDIYPDFDISMQVSEENHERSFLLRSDTCALGGHTFTRTERTMDEHTRASWQEILNHLAKDQGVRCATALETHPISATVDYLVPVSASFKSVTSTYASDANIPFDSLFIIGTDHGLALARRRDDTHEFERIVINHPSLVIPLAFTNEARLIMDISRTSYKAMAGFSWAQLEGMKRLPEVRYGNVVLRPAEWTIPKQLNDAAREAIKKQDYSLLRQALSQIGIHEDFIYASGDNRLHFDTRSQVSLAMAAKLLKTAGRTDRLEKSSIDYCKGVELASSKGKCRLSTEIILSVSRRIKCKANVPVEMSLPINTNTIEVRDDRWISIILLAVPEFLDELIIHAAHFTQTQYMKGIISTWFYVRYNDDGCSVRLRWKAQSGPEQLIPKVIELATQLRNSALIRGWQITEYSPETHRYGKGKLLDNIHEAFRLSSELAVKELNNKLSYTSEDDIVDIGDALESIINYLDLLGVPSELYCDILPSHAKPTTAAREYWRKISHSGTRPHDDDGRFSLISTPSPFMMISRLSENRSQVVRIVADMLHMHCNRLRSSGDSFEESMYWLLRRDLHKRRMTSDGR